VRKLGLSPEAEQVTQALERILASPLFSRADRQSRFLRYVVQKRLAGDEAALRETVIGLEVYERPATYDPKTDPIVRVEAARLRGRLREYYETAGPGTAVRIQLPKGSYVPSFGWWIAPEPVPAPSPEAPVESPAKGKPRRWLVLTALGVLLGAAGLFLFRRPPHAVSAKPIESIAVMPFSDLSEKKDQGYLSAGLTEQIQEELTRIRDLRVVGSATTKRASANPDLRSAARQMGADALLEGSVRAEERKLRVTVRLYEGGTGAAIWSGSFDSERTDLLGLEEKIARALAAKLAIQLAVRREGVDARRAPQRAQAHEYLEQARVLRERISMGALDEPYRLLQLAVATDQTYASAHAALASILIWTRGALGGAGGGAKALDEVNKALQLDPGLPSAHSALILYYRDIEMNWTKARQACASSLERYPNAPAIVSECGSVEGILGVHSKEVGLLRRAVLLDPLSAETHSGLMLALYRAGRFDDALGEADAAIRLGPQNYFLRRHRAWILAAQGDLAGALKTIDDAREQLGGVPEDWMTVRGYILGRLGRRAEVDQLIGEFTRLRAGSANNLAAIYLGLGERTKALDLFEQGLKNDRVGLTHSVPQYWARPLDGDPRFEAIKRKLGLVP
jgi:TolB-like protein/Flp pilus assembly protein TadD